MTGREAILIKHRLLALAVSILGLVGVAAGLPSPATAAVGPRPMHSDSYAWDAPVGGKGGINAGHVWCSSGEPRVRVAIESLRTGETYDYRWRGALPNMAFPRVGVGRYEVRTNATCRTTTKTWVETVQVKEKTAQRTVSWAEWRRIRRGMTVDRVRQIIGYPGEGYRYGRSMSRRYDTMRFWSWSVVEYRDGRVVSKMWNVPHD